MAIVHPPKILAYASSHLQDNRGKSIQFSSQSRPHSIEISIRPRKALGTFVSRSIPSLIAMAGSSMAINSSWTSIVASPSTTTAQSQWTWFCVITD